MAQLENKHTTQDLKTMQEWSLQRKIQVTQTRIIEWYQKFDGRVYVSFSGGKDSTVLLDLARRIYPDIKAVYVDTGLEYPEIKEFVKKVDNVEILKPQMNFRQVIIKYGYPLLSKETAANIYYARKAKARGDNARYNRYVNGERVNKKTGLSYKFMPMSKLARKVLNSDIPVHNICCTIMKKSPCKNFEKKSGLKPIVATMACESKLRQNAWLKNGCNAFEGKRPISQPMSFWTEQDVLEYISRFKIEYANVYGEIQRNCSGESIIQQDVIEQDVYSVDLVVT